MLLSFLYGRVASGGHGLFNVSLRPAMPFSSMTCGPSPLGWPYSCFRGGCPKSWHPAAVFYPLGYPKLFLCFSHRIYSTVGVDSIFNILWHLSPLFFEVQQLRESKLLKAVRIAYVVRVRYLEKNSRIFETGFD
jgi:hypothetical protein